jgi:TrkA-C domain
MIAVLSLLIIASVTLLIGRVATLALTATGMPREAARFQARSALTGVGFTTSESEYVFGHPVRRRIVMELMFVGPIGIIASSGTLIAAMATASGARQATTRMAALAVGLLVLVVGSRSRWVDRHLTSVLALIVRRTTHLDVRDYAKMLRLAGDYEIAELRVEPGDWLAGRTLAEADLPHEGILVLGIVHQRRLPPSACRSGSH